MNSTGEEDQEEDPPVGYGCFWSAGTFGAFIITALIIGEWVGFPQLDGPFGGFFWMIAQTTCFLICLAASIRAAKDASVSRDQRIWMWVLTLYPPTVLLVMVLGAAVTAS